MQPPSVIHIGELESERQIGTSNDENRIDQIGLQFAKEYSNILESKKIIITF